MEVRLDCERFVAGTALLEFDKSIMKYPNIQRFPGGASNDLIPDLQHPKNPVPALDINNLPKAVPSSD